MTDAFFTCSDGTQVFVSQGTKSPYDFIVRYRSPGKRVRTPKHIHIIIDLLIKREHEPALTEEFVRHIVDGILPKLDPISELPPKLIVFGSDQMEKYAKLDAFGDYKTDFLLVVIELLMLQEVTNYPAGTLNRTLFSNFLSGADIFTIVGTATFRG